MIQNEKKLAWCLQKAQHNLEAAIFFDRNGYSDWSASAFFYCSYHCFLAILRKYGYESRNQECTIAVMEHLREQGIINISKTFIEMLINNKTKDIDFSLIEIREEFQYGVNKQYTDRKVFDMSLKTSQSILEQTRLILYGEN